MRRTVVTAGVLLCTLALTSGCGDEEPAAGPVGSGTSEDPITITVEDGEVTPSGARVEVEPGTIVFEVTADTGGELGIHTDPETELSFEEGTTTLEVDLEQPGVYEVETHDPEVVVVQLQVG